MTLRPTLKSKRTRTFVLFFLLFLMLPFSFQCVKTPLDFKKPIAPEWSVPLNIQLIDRTWTFGDMIAKDPKFNDTTGSIVYRPTSVVSDPTKIVLLELSPYQSSMTKTLGPLELDVPSLAIGLTFKQIFNSDPPVDPITGLPIPWPGNDTSITIPSQDVPNPNSKYDWLKYKNGRMSLRIVNTFPFGISFAGPAGGVELVNTDTVAAPGDFVVAKFVFSGIIAGNGGDQTVPVPVTGKVMSAKLKLRFTIQTSGIKDKIITATDKLSAQLTISADPPALKASMSAAMVEFASDQPVDSIPKAAVQIVDDTTSTPTKIKRAEFLDGKFLIRITNNIATRISAFFKLPEFVDLKGNPFQLDPDSETVTIAARGKLEKEVHLKEYAIQSQDIVGNDTLSVRDVNYSLSIKALRSQVGRVKITEDDFVTVEIIPENNDTKGTPKYILKKVIGKVRPTPVTIDKTVPAALGDVGNKFSADNIKFDSVSITLNILMKGSFPTDLTMKIIGLDKNGKEGAALIARELHGTVLSDTIRINPDATTKITFDKLHSLGGQGIDQFLSSFFSGGSGSLPQSFKVIGQALVDPPSVYQIPASTGTVDTGSSILTSVDFTFPVRVGIINGIYKDTIAISDTSGNKIDKKNLAQIDSGKIIFTIDNTFPFRLDVNSWLLPALPHLPKDTLKADPDTTHVLLSLPKKGEAIIADSARYFTPRTPSDTIGKTAKVIDLTPDDVVQINPASFVAVAINMKTAGNNNPVAFKKNYYVQLKAFLSVRFNVNFDKLK